MVKITKDDKEWKELLSDEQYRITRKAGTERAGTGPHQNEKRDGIFKCVCCGNDLYETSAKYESGTGWPSYFKPISETAVSEHEDKSWFSTRTEIRCADCDAHVGHVFPDGPEPTGLRYCMNGHALTFHPDDDQAKDDTE